MSDTAIRVENLGKMYRIGRAQQRHDTLRDTIAAGLSSLRPGAASEEETIWALKDVSFEVKRGEVLGVIGRNGAGKSTLLKILSRITEPTTGHAEIHGRVGSLLEVGTGFHPELTGRENIYLNGAILGMRRTEIARRFDEIVAFAEIDKFLDTPVKHYSSGMYVRLAFAVAAHLDPEILLVDEVLAVGDADFQKKCLTTMGDVARCGRTVLFVSHNLAAIRTLCPETLLLSCGTLAFRADSEQVVSSYLASHNITLPELEWNFDSAPTSPEIRFLRARVTDLSGKTAVALDCRDAFNIELEYEVLKHVAGLRIGFVIKRADEVVVTGSSDWGQQSLGQKPPGVYRSRCTLPGNLLNAGRFSIMFAADLPPHTNQAISTPYCITFTVEDLEGHGPKHGPIPGILRPAVTWEITCLSVRS